jgi:hypothetical protein
MTHADVIHDESGRHRRTRRISFSGTVSNRVAGNSLKGFLKFASRHFYGSLIINSDPGQHHSSRDRGKLQHRKETRSDTEIRHAWNVTFPENGIRSNLAENQEREREMKFRGIYRT